jgi:hypothetical protein
MATRNTPAPRVDMDDPAVTAILAALIADFSARGLSADDLRGGYQGPAPADLRQQCLVLGDFGGVEYNLARKSLISANLVKTGPMKMLDNDPNSSVLFIGFRSEEKFTFLTETGYQQANRLRTSKPRAVSAAAQHVHISGGTFNNSPIGIGNDVAQTLNLNAAGTDQLIAKLREEVLSRIDDASRQQDILAKLDELQAAHDKPTKIERYIQVMGAIGDHITVLGFILTPLMRSLHL